MAYRILVGSYTDDVYTLDFNPSSKSLKLVAKTRLGTKPSWITQHPNDPTLIFAGLEQTEGKVVAVKFDNDNGEGRIVGEASSGGADPCSVLATENELIVANVSRICFSLSLILTMQPKYASGSLAFIPLLSAMPFEAPYAVKFGEPVTIQLKYNTEPDSKRNQARQEASHAHQAILHPTSDDLLVPNLGADEVCRFQKTDTGKWESVRSIQYKTGGGPRHVAFYRIFNSTLHLCLASLCYFFLQKTSCTPYWS